MAVRLTAINGAAGGAGDPPRRPDTARVLVDRHAPSPIALPRSLAK
jgi:hypothetical protein